MTKFYGTITRDMKKKRWVLENIAPHVVMRLKRVFPKIRVSAHKTITLPYNNESAADLQWFFSRYPFTGDKSALNALKRMNRDYNKHQKQSEALLMPDHQPTQRVGFKSGQGLRDYQALAVDFAEHVGRLLLIDEMGLGKTYEGLGMATLPGKLPLVIVMEPGLQAQWLKKAESFVEHRVHAVKGNTPYPLPEADIYLFKYTQLGPWADILSRGWVKGVVFDEVQNLRTGLSSDKGIGAQALCQSVDFIVGMTGTLIYNYGIEAWNILNIIYPGFLGTHDEFLREWCYMTSDNKGVVKDPDALGQYLRDANVVLRRDRKDVGQESNQKEPEIIKVSPDDAAVKDMETLADQLAMRVVESSGFYDRRDAAGEFDRSLRQMTGIAKAKAVAAFVRMLIESGNPVLLFGYHHEVYNIWEKELADLCPAWVTGRQTPSQKEKEKRRFLNEETDLLIMSLHSGTGVDELQYRASNVVIGELDWSPSKMEQCIRRLDRDGQLWWVYVYYIISDFGSDPAMLDVLGVKDEQARGIQDPNKKKASKQADPDRIKKMAASYLAKRGIRVESQSEGPSNETLALSI